MREIKFRAWHTEQKRMIEVYGLGKDFLTENTFDGVDPGTNAFCGDEMNFLKVMQYTGLKDKNGMEIYEGDLLHRHMNVYWIVTFKDGKWIALPKEETGLYLDYSQFEECEVAGNQFQHPELLTPPIKK